MFSKESPIWLFCLALAGVLFVFGCGGGDDPEAGEDEPKPGENAGKKDKQPGGKKSDPVVAKADPKRGYWIDERGTRMLYRVPVNVFYNDPVAVLADNRSVGPGNPAKKDPPGNPVVGTDGKKPMGMGGMPDPMKKDPMPKPPPAGSKNDWKNLITKTMLEDEMNAQVNGLRADLASVRTYNDAFRAKRFATRAATVAGLAQIADEHPDAVRWKDKAKLLVVIASKLDEAASKAGRGGRDPALEQFEKISEIMSGSVPAGAKPRAADSDLSDFAGRGGMMKRLSDGFSWMQKNIKDKDRFSKEAERVDREAAVLASFSQMIMHESYVFADEEKYRTAAQGMVTAAVKIRDAVSAKDFDTFRSQLDWIQKRCTDCHNEYVGGQ